MTPLTFTLRRLPTIAALLFLVLAFAGHAARGQAAPYVPDPAYYAYDNKTPFTATERPYKQIGDIKVTIVTYPSPVTTPFAINNTVTAYLFLPPTPGPHPAMLVMHERLPVNLGDEFTLCEAIARSQIAAFLIIQPYSVNRRPNPGVPQAELLSGNVTQMVGALRQCVLDSRRGIDWLSRRPDIDPARLGISGISLGAVLAPLIAGVDRRLKVMLLLDGGGEVAQIIWHSPLLTGLRPELDRRGYNEKSVTAALAPVEPAHWLAGWDPKNALLVNGRYDVFLKPPWAKSLARALGGAPIVWTNTGHYGLAFSVQQAEDMGARFLRSRFFLGEPPFHAPDTLPSRTIKLGILLGGREAVSPALAYQMLNLDKQARFSLDGQLTRGGLSVAPSVRIDTTTSIGVEFPLRLRPGPPRLFLLEHFVL